MGKVNRADAVRLMQEGKIVEFGERYYRYDKVKKEVQYSDYNKNSWKTSSVTINEFLAGTELFNVVD